MCFQLSSRQLWSFQTRISKTREVNRGWKKREVFFHEFMQENSTHCHLDGVQILCAVVMCKTELFSTLRIIYLKADAPSQCLAAPSQPDTLERIKTLHAKATINQKGQGFFFFWSLSDLVEVAL